MFISEISKWVSWKHATVVERASQSGIHSWSLLDKGVFTPRYQSQKSHENWKPQISSQRDYPQ